MERVKGEPSYIAQEAWRLLGSHTPKGEGKDALPWLMLYAQVVSPEVPGDCNGVVLRGEKFLFKVQNALHHKHWGSGWAFDEFFAGNEAGRGYAYVTDIFPAEVSTDARLDRARPASDWKSESLPKTPQGHKPLAKETYKFPIRRIIPKRC